MTNPIENAKMCVRLEDLLVRIYIAAHKADKDKPHQLKMELTEPDMRTLEHFCGDDDEWLVRAHRRYTNV